jgi:small subunit ribosomal protein S2
MKQLLEAGVHFGHQTKRWNPKMKEFIFGERNGIYIIDLQKSLRLFKNALQFVQDIGASGKTILFLGTKRQAQDVIQEEAVRCGMYYVNQRWLGGLLTNFVTIQKSLKRFREIETMKANGQYDLFSKKEIARYERERKQLEKNLSGIKDMAILPNALFVIDTKKEAIAIHEARKLGIPIIGVADTNCDPDDIDFIIPGNDDALRAIRLITSTVAQAFLDGKALYEAQQKELAEQMEKQRQLQAQQAAAAREAAARAAAAAAEAAARRAAESGEPAETPAAEGAAAPAEGRPKTTVRKALQRKAKPRRTESETAPEAASPVAAEADVAPIVDNAEVPMAAADPIVEDVEVPMAAALPATGDPAKPQDPPAEGPDSSQNQEVPGN